MKINTKERYGLRALAIVAALGKKETPISIQWLAEEQNLSPEYLEKMFAKFKKAGITKSRKGIQGGYYIDKDLKSITLEEIFIALDTPFGVSDTVDSQLPIFQVMNKLVWQDINQEYGEYIKHHTLEEVKSNYLDRNQLKADAHTTS